MDRKQNPFLYPLKLPAAIPKSVRYVLILGHVFALLLPWWSDIALAFKLLFSTAVLVSLVYYVHYSAWVRQERDIAALMLDAEDHWQILQRDGRTVDAEFGPFQYVTPWLTILGLSMDGRRLYFIYTQELLDADTFRRLRVRLLHRVQTQEHLA